MTYFVKDNAYGRLASALSDIATEISLEAGQGGNFTDGTYPNSYKKAVVTIVQYSDQEDQTSSVVKREKILIDNVNVDTLEISERGYGDSDAESFNEGDWVYIFLVEEIVEDLYTHESGLMSNSVSLGFSVGSTLIQGFVIGDHSITIGSSGVQLVNDSASPGNDKYYGTGPTGVRGFHDLPTSSGGISGVLSVPDGGTGKTTLTGVIIGAGASPFTTKTNPNGAFVGDTDEQLITNKRITGASIGTAVVTGGTINSSLVRGGTINSSRLVGVTITSSSMTSGTINTTNIFGSTISGYLYNTVINGVTASDSVIYDSRMVGGTITNSRISGGNISSTTINGSTVSALITGSTLLSSMINGSTLTNPAIQFFNFAQHNHQGSTTGGKLDHGVALNGLSDDDHTQYALLAGRSGGQGISGNFRFNNRVSINTSTISDGATLVPNLDNGNIFYVTLGGNRNVAAPNGTPYDGDLMTLAVKQDGTGSRTLTFDTIYGFGTDGQPTLTTTANKIDYMSFRYHSGVTKWHCQGFKAGF